MKKIQIYKKASGVKLDITVANQHLEMNLLDYLVTEQNLPIARSCGGEQVCKRCIFNKKKLLCSFKVKEVSQMIVIDYL